MNIETLKKSDMIIYETLVGSRAYNTYVETSDFDYRGIFVVPLNKRISLKQPLTEIGQEKPEDIKYYEVEKFLTLAQDCNPNIIELLFMPKDCIKVCTPIMQKILDNRHIFISKKAFHTFGSYAFSQIKKCRGENKWINNPKPKDPPKREDFCWVVPKENFMLTNFNIGTLPPARPIPILKFGLDLSQFHASSLEHIPNTFRLYHYGDKAKGVFRNGNIALESIPLEDEFVKFWGIMIYNDNEYQKAMMDWKNYWIWMKERNPNRWIAQEKGEMDYDCYLDEETEFLTNNGWKKFNDVLATDTLGTISESHNIIFQEPTSRFKSLYSGIIYTYENRYTRFSITPNHKIYVSDAHRKKSNGFSTKYDKNNSNWHLETMEEFIRGRRSHKHILASLINNKKDYNISDDDIILIGAYLSEGSIAFDRKGFPQAIYIAQNNGRPLCSMITKIQKYKINLTQHKRKNRIENTYRIQNKYMANEFLNLYGHGCNNKKIADFIYNFSNRQFNLLLDILMMGDGHKHCKGHRVYYSTSKCLTEQLQYLCFLNGILTQVYGPYFYEDRKYQKLPLYQLFISKKEYSSISFTKYYSRRNFGLVKRNVINKNIVCFSVPNSILITRNKNKIAVQGNSKNLQHCVRLLLSTKKILTSGEPIVRFEGDALQFLRDIRAGKFSYDEIMKIIEENMKEIEVLEKESKLQYGADKDAIDKLFQEIIFSS